MIGMGDRICNVLFLCTGNSARSILAEGILNHDGAGRFRGYSAGSQPKGAVHPMALRVLTEAGIELPDARSKSWGEFAQPGAPPLDFIFTVCANAAGETCPVWPGRPISAHWGIPDPAAVEGEGQHRAFVVAFAALRHRMSLFTSLPLAALDELAMTARLKAIGNQPERGLA